MKIICVDQSTPQHIIQQIREIEFAVTYPLGDDFFRIDHGKDYFAFFKRLGKLRYYCAMDDNRLAGVGAGVLRKIGKKKTWYLCDLKVRPEYQGRHIPLRILRSAFLFNYLRCPRGYAISMNPSDGRPNRVIKLLRKFKLAKLSSGPTLFFYSLDFESMNRLKSVIEKHRGPISYRSLSESKQLILNSTGQAMKLLHLEYGSQTDQNLHQDPQKEHIHMLCAPDGDPLNDALKDLGIPVSASASIVHHRMDHWDWRFVLTSDI